MTALSGIKIRCDLLCKELEIPFSLSKVLELRGRLEQDRVCLNSDDAYPRITLAPISTRFQASISRRPHFCLAPYTDIP